MISSNEKRTLELTMDRDRDGDGWRSSWCLGEMLDSSSSFLSLASPLLLPFLSLVLPCSSYEEREGVHGEWKGGFESEWGWVDSAEGCSRFMLTCGTKGRGGQLNQIDSVG